MGGVNLEAYLNRIGYRGPRTPGLETLRAVQAAHLDAIPYENLDIHLGRELPLSAARAYDKIVGSGRGGWCFEMNGLLGWALEELGFQVTYLSSAVLYSGGTSPDGDHLILLVTLPDGAYLTDAGFGDGAIHPLPLRAGQYRAGFLEYRLDRAGETWTMHNHARSSTGGFQFRLEPRALTDFAPRCTALQTDPASGFVRTTVCQRITESALYTLRGATLSVLTLAGETKRTLENAEEYQTTLLEKFRLELPEAARLWERVWARHLEWQAQQAQG